MSLWFATVDFWISDGLSDPPRCEKLHFLVESENAITVDRDARAVADANAPFGKKLHAIEFRQAHTVHLPARVHSRPQKGNV